MLAPVQKAILEILARRSGIRLGSILKKAERAPKGGVYLVTLDGGKFYLGGQWIPASEIANLPPAEKAKLEAAQQQAKMNRVQRGDIDPQLLAGQLKPHARKLSAEENSRAVGELRALHNYHGDLTLHRIEQLANQQQQFLKRANLTDKQRQQIEGNLARLHAMTVTAKRLGVTGKVPKEMQQQALAKTAKEPPQHLKKPEENVKQQPKQAIPSTSENHPANPDASGFLHVDKFYELPQFKDKDGKVDTAKADAALGEIVRRHQQGGGQVKFEGEGLRFLPPEKKEEKSKAEEKPAEAPELAKRPQEEAGNQVKAPWQMSAKEFSESGIKVFRTSQGSLYAYSNGQTLRVKSPHVHVGHEKTDVGLKRGSSKTYFLDEKGANEIGMWNSLQGTSGKRLIVQGDEILLTSLNPATGKRGLDGRVKIHSDTPQRGLAPIELFDPSSQGEGWYKGNHPGNAIAEMLKPDHAVHEEFVEAARRAAKDVSGSSKEKPPARSESPMSPEEATKALAKQAGHVAQPKEGSDAASELNRQLMEEGAPKPQQQASEETKPAHPAADMEDDFRAAEDKALAADPIAQKLRKKGDVSAAQERILRNLIADGVSIPERVQQKFPGEYARANESVQKEAGGSPDERTQRLRENQVLNYGPGHATSKERSDAYEREVWAGKARKEGIESEHLHAVAEQILKEDEEHREQRRRILKDARELLAHYGYNAGLLTANLRSNRVEDNIPAFDLVAGSISTRYPEAFNHEGQVYQDTRHGYFYDDPNSSSKAPGVMEQLQEMFREGVPPRKSQEQAYEGALAYLMEVKQAQEPKPRPRRFGEGPRGYLAESREEGTKPQGREPGVDDEEDEGQSGEPWLSEEDEDDPFATQWKRLRMWIQKARRVKPQGPTLPGLFDEAQHPREAAGSSHGGRFADKHVQDALSRYANRTNTALGGGLFGGEDLQGRHGFAKLSHDTPIVFTAGEFEGHTGKIVRDVDAPTGAPRIVAEVDGRPGLVPVSPDSIEPLDVRHSWRTEGGGAGREETQGTLYTAEHYLPRREEKSADQVQDAFDRYEAIKTDLSKLSVEEMRARFAEMAALPKSVLAGVLAKLGYPSEATKADIENALLDNLTSLKISLDQTSRI